MDQDIYDQMAQQEAQQREAAMAASLRGMAGVNPDQQAKVLQLSRSTGIPTAVVERNQQAIEVQRRAREMSDLASRSPVLARQLGDFEFAKLAHDDAENLDGIEQTIGKVASYAMGARRDSGLPGDLSRMARSIAAGFGPQFGASAYGAAAYPAEALGMDGLGEQLRGLQRSSQGVADAVAGANPDAGVIERGIMAGMRSAGQTMATLPLGFTRAAAVTGEQLMLGSMGALTFGQSYGKARDQGASVGQSGLYGMQDAAAEVVSEKFLGAAKLIGDAKAGMGAAKMFVRDIAREIPGEMGATLWQNFNEWANLNPEKSLNEWLQEQPDAMVETIIATVAGGGAQVGAIRGVQKIMGDAARRDAQASQAEEAGAMLEQLAKFGQASKTLQRDAQTVREFVAQVAGEDGDAPTEFYVDGEQLVNVLNQSGMSRAEIDALIPVAAGQIEAAAAGGMVRLPVSEFMVMGDKAVPLIDHIRTSEDAPTRTESRAYMTGAGKELQADVEREMAKRSDADMFRASIATVQAEYQRQLEAAGQTSDVAKVNATLTANWYGTMAARANMTLDKFGQKYRLGVVSQALSGPRTMTQGEPTPTGAIDQSTGLPLNDDGTVTVYHHTSAANAAEIRRTGMLKSAGEPDLYFTTTATTDTGYGDTAVPFRVRPERLILDDEFSGGRKDFRVETKRADKARRVTFRDGGDAVLNQATPFEQGRAASGLPDPPAEADAAAQKEALIALRKRESVLKSLLECVGG